MLVDDQGNARICDFGLSKLLGQTGFTTDLKATLRYMAPELSAAILEHDDDAVEGSDTNRCLDYPCDIYSLAMTILEVRRRVCRYISCDANSNTLLMWCLCRWFPGRNRSSISRLMAKFGCTSMLKNDLISEGIDVTA